MKHGDEKHFFDPVTRQNLKSIKDANKTVSLTTSKGKLIQYQEQRDLVFKLLVRSQMLNAPIDLNVLISYSLSHVPHCLGTPDGFFFKTNKTSMLRFLMEDYNVDVQHPEDSMFIQDGNALFHTLVNLPPTFGGICLQIYDVKKEFYFLKRFLTSRFHKNARKKTTWMWRTVYPGWISNEKI